MNPIDEMMKKYGVTKVHPCDICDRLAPGDQTGYACMGCIHCGQDEEIYPPFTPEKQLEIIKLISQRTPFWLDIEEKDKRTIFTINTDFGSANHFSFDKALAEFLTKIFYYCSTEAQRQQIKEILEG